MTAWIAVANSTSLLPPSTMPFSSSNSITSMTNALRTPFCADLMDRLMQRATSNNPENRNTKLSELVQNALFTGHAQFCKKNSMTCEASAFETLCGEQQFQKRSYREFFLQLLINKQLKESFQIAEALPTLLDRNAAFYLLAPGLRAAGRFDEADNVQKQIVSSGTVTTRLLVEPNPETVESMNQVIVWAQLAKTKDFNRAIQFFLQIQEPIFQDMALNLILDAVCEEIEKTWGKSELNQTIINIFNPLSVEMREKIVAYWNHLNPNRKIRIQNS